MNFFKKIFGKNKKVIEPKSAKNPDNTRLIYLLDVFSQNASDKNYSLVVSEILNGSSYFLYPTTNNGKQEGRGWETIEKGQTLAFTSVFDLDGMKVLGAFTDEKALFNWAKKPTRYVALPTNILEDICKQVGVVRIVINSGQKNMFVLQRNNENFKERVIEKLTPAKIGTPSKPIDRHILGKLIENFKNVSTVERAYQYFQVINNEGSLVLGICMSSVSAESKAALYTAVNNAFEGEKQNSPIDILILTDDDLIEAVSQIENSLFYAK